MKLVIHLLILLLLHIDVNGVHGIDIECDETKNDEYYHCIYSGLNQTSENLEYNFVERNVGFWRDTPNLLYFTEVSFKSSQLLIIPRNLFQKYKNLEHLQMIKCGITKLERNIFDFAKNLVALNLSKNKLTNLGNSSFVGAQNLRSLDLSGNQIEKIHETAFLGIENLKSIDLSNNRLVNIGSHLFEENTKLTEIYLNGNRFQTLKLNFSENRSDELQLIDASFNQIANFSIKCQKSSNSNNFQLNLSNNHIKNLEIDTNCTVTHLNIANNNISDLSAVKQLSTLWKTLKALTISFNKISQLDGELLLSLQNLETIDLSDNQLENISSYLFNYNTQLQKIYLNRNRLQTLKLDFSDNRPNSFMIIDASYNQLTNFTIKCQKSSNSKHFYLNLSNNHITNLEIDTNCEVKNFYISRNNISDLSAVSQLSTLWGLDASFNKIDTLPVDIFANLTALKHLNLVSTGIKDIDYGTFSHQTKLEILDISYNQLKNIELSMFVSLTELQTLIIHGNNLTSLDLNILFEIFPKLKQIGIQNNLFDCTALSKTISELNKRNVTILVPERLKVLDKSNVKGVGCIRNSTFIRLHDKLDKISNSVDINNSIETIINATMNQQMVLNKLKEQFIQLSSDKREFNNRFQSTSKIPEHNSPSATETKLEVRRVEMSVTMRVLIFITLILVVGFVSVKVLAWMVIKIVKQNTQLQSNNTIKSDIEHSI